MLTLVVLLVILPAVPIHAGSVKLTSNKEGRFTCPGDLVTFTCEVFGSASLEWRSPLVPQAASIRYTTSVAPNTIHQDPFTSFLIKFNSSGPLNANFTSTLEVNASRMFMRNETTVMCLSSTSESETDNFIVTEMPAVANVTEIKVERTTHGESTTIRLTCTWMQPQNFDQFDVDHYDINVTSNSSVQHMTMACGECTNTTVTVSENSNSVQLKTTFTATIAAVNLCGETGSLGTASYTLNKNAGNVGGAIAGGVVGGIVGVGIVVFIVAVVCIKRRSRKVKKKKLEESNEPTPHPRESPSPGDPRPTGPPELEEELKKKDQELEKTRQELEKTRQELEKTRQELEDQQQESNTAKVKLQEKIDRLEKTKTEHEKRIRELENELEGMRHQLEENKNELLNKMEEHQAETRKLIQDLLESSGSQEKRRFQDEEEERRFQQEKEEKRRLQDEEEERRGQEEERRRQEEERRRQEEERRRQEEERRRQEEQITNMQSAARHGDVETLKSLVHQRADINMECTNGRTLLHMAVEEGHMETVKYLVQEGASIDTKDDDGTTPLDMAIEMRHTEIAKHLEEVYTNTLGGQDNIQVVNGGHVKVVKGGTDTDPNDNKGMTPLGTPNQTDSSETSECHQEADTSLAEGQDKTQLYQAVNGGHVKEVKGGTDVNPNYHRKPLLIAARLNDLDTMQYHVDNGADINIRGVHKETPLHVAAREGNMDAAQFLIRNGADVNIKDKDGRTPLDVATEGGHVEIEEMIKRAKEQTLQQAN